MPRTASTAVAEKAMLGPWPLGDWRPSSWLISAVCRCEVGAKERISPLRWGWWDAGPDSAPPADDPVLPSTTIGIVLSTTPARVRGYSPRMVAVARQPPAADPLDGR